VSSSSRPPGTGSIQASNRPGEARCAFEGASSAACDRGQWIVVDRHVEIRFAPQHSIEAWQERAAADEHQPAIGDVGGQLRWCSFEQVLDCRDDLCERPFQGIADLVGVEPGPAKQSRLKVTTGDFAGACPLGARDGAAELELQLLRLLLTDQQLFLLLRGAHDRFVELVPADLDRVSDHEPAEGRDRDLARAAADVDDQRARRFRNRQAGADCRRERLVDQRRVRHTSAARRLLDRAPLDRRDPARHAHDHMRPEACATEHATDEVAQHLLRHLEVGNDAVTERPRCTNVRRGPSDHLPGLLADSLDRTGTLVDRDDGGFEQNDPVPASKHDGVGRSEVDRQMPRRLMTPESHPNHLPTKPSRRLAGEAWLGTTLRPRLYLSWHAATT
jgi:hypothetical protein